MSDIVPVTAGGLALPDDLMTVGMEDFDSSTDAIMPTIRIDHVEGVFVDALSGEKLEKLDVVVLGLIKQRVLWEPEVEENSKGPLCRSYDFKQGFPDPDRFPWKDEKVIAARLTPDMEALPCEACPLQEWGSHPKRDTPWCSEQHTFPILQIMDDGGYSAALLTIQRSAIKPSRTYLTSFSRSRTAIFTVRTLIELDHRKRGTVPFAVPKFTKGPDTDSKDWPFFAKNFLEIKEFVTTPRFRLDEDAAPAAAHAAPAATEATEATATPVATPAAAPAAAPDEDDLPF